VVVPELQITCDCGWRDKGPEEAVVAAALAHAREAHGMELTRAQVIAAAAPVDRPNPDR
jgi:predicted small metal-binding protein